MKLSRNSHTPERARQPELNARRGRVEAFTHGDRFPEHTCDLTTAYAAKALAHPIRMALLRALSGEPRCCGHLVRDLADQDQALAQSTVSQHLRLLVEAGLVDRRRCGVESFYSLNPDAFIAPSEAIGAFAGTSRSAEAR